MSDPVNDPERDGLQGDRPAEQRKPMIPPDDPCQDLRCSRIDGRCVGSHCGRCGAPSSYQGHYTSICSNRPRPQPLASNAPFHFCCPDDCELANLEVIS